MNTLNLNGKWTLSNSLNRKELKDISMNIPGDVHSALLREKIISDPYVGFNEKDVQWVGKENWKITRKFSFKKQTGLTSYLVLESADTFFRIAINGKKCGDGDNYFRTYRFDVTKYLQNGENSIEVEFFSSEKEAISRAKKLSYEVPCSEYDVFSPNRNLVRKIQCQSGWDWGPCLMAFGIYGSIRLESVSSGYIESVCVNTMPVSSKEISLHNELADKQTSTSKVSVEKNKSTGSWEAKISVRYFSLKAQTVHFIFELTGNSSSAVGACMKELSAGENEFATSIQIDNPVLWKSADELKENNEKENSLYTLTVSSLASRDNTQKDKSNSAKKFAEPQTDSEMTKHIGFRTLVLNATKDKNGCSLYYCLNGRSIFAKGANWVPVDSLPERWTEERYRYLLQSAVDSNMNSLRFWGGGQYENETCYNICDRLGIIIWQDCMFACSLYPSNEEFLESVEKEIADNVYRLQSHASLAVWCGNNENLGAITWYEVSKKNRDRYIVDYDRLNNGTVEKTIKRCDPERSWWPSSPCAGPGTFGDNWHNDAEGDMHFWSVWHEKKSFEAYLSIKPRFVSEFGYESFPSLEGVKEYASEGELNLTSPVMEYHQRSPGGNSIMLENFSRYFRFPSGTANMLYLSQVQQALAVKTAVQYWRSLRPYCMGATYWQLNDVWPVASWSSIEYSGKWKLLQYEAKKFFAPLTFSLIKKDGILYAYIVNETMRNVDCEVTLNILKFDGTPAGKKITLTKKVESDSSVCVWKMEDKELPVQKEQCFIYGAMNATSDGKKAQTITDTLFPSLQKKCSLEKAKITTSVTEKDGVFTIALSATKPAFYTMLEVPGVHGIFSDNMITLLPGKQTVVTFTLNNYGWGKEFNIPQEKTKTVKSAEELKKLLTVTTLRNTYE